MFQSLIADGGYENDIKSWEAGVGWGLGSTWPDYWWDHHHQQNYFDDPAKNVPGQADTFEQ